MPFQKLLNFTTKVADLADQPALTTADLKAQFDAAPDEVRVYLNTLIDALGSTTDSDSGADGIGVTPIDGLTGSTVQTLFESVKSAIDNAVLGQILDGSIGPEKLSFSAETTTGAQIKANQAETDAINYAKGFGLGADAATPPSYLSDITETGFYYAPISTNNTPISNNDYWVLHFKYGTDDALQVAFMHDPDERVFYRRKSISSWTQWREFITTKGAKFDETGFCGVGGPSKSGINGTACAGIGVNFRTKRVNTPSSVTLTPTSNNTSPVSIDLNKDGFWLYINGDGSEAFKFWRGYYTVTG